MAYSRHEWINGETITAEKLNCIEGGIDCLANCENLWTNPQPESSFAAQDIMLDLHIYRVVEFCVITKVNDLYMNFSVIIDKRRAYRHNGSYNAILKYGNYERTISVFDDRIHFSDCTYAIKYNDKLIPYSVHGFE